MDWLKTAPAAEVESILEEYNVEVSETIQPEEVDMRLVSQIESALDQYEASNQQVHQKGKIIYRRFFFRMAAASLIILAASFGAYLAVKTPDLHATATAHQHQLKKPGAPGGNKAILTLSDGSNVILDDAKNGQVAEQAGAHIAKLTNGQLVYKALNEKPTTVVFNTLTTPRGGQFKLTLPDGSDVWLNAASSIRYPTAFTGNERNVEISGEAYFEIAHDASKPFRVKVNGLEVRVLGTHFNVNAYNDELAVKTTLLEGSVRLTKEDTTATLMPGQQAEAGDKRFKVIDHIDIDQVVAWKNGYFSFYKADLQSVMRQIARWYDVEIHYDGKLPPSAVWW